METIRKDIKKSKWVEEFRINWYDADCTGRLSLPALCGFLEETAWRHATHLGFGWSETTKQHSAWVLVRLAMQIDEWPKWNQSIRVVSWSRGVDKLFAYRDFRIEDMRGCALAHVTSTWLVLDFESRRPIRPELVKDALKYVVSDRALDIDAVRLAVPQSSVNQFLGDISVGYPDIDLNGHTNNIRYPEWVLRFLPETLLKEESLNFFSINYLAESHAGDQISIYSSGDYSDYLVGGIRKSDNKCVFTAQFKF